VGKWAFSQEKFQIGANRLFWGKKRLKSAIFRKCLRIFLPTFGFQNRAFAHFFWAFFKKIVRTRSKIFSKVGFRPNPPNKSGLKFTQFSSMYGLISLISKPVRSVYQPE
jgi:hypothetical protein